jgi:hypothetical protein
MKTLVMSRTVTEMKKRQFSRRSRIELVVVHVLLLDSVNNVNFVCNLISEACVAILLLIQMSLLVLLSGSSPGEAILLARNV